MLRSSRHVLGIKGVVEKVLQTQSLLALDDSTAEEKRGINKICQGDTDAEVHTPFVIRNTN